MQLREISKPFTSTSEFESLDSFPLIHLLFQQVHFDCLLIHAKGLPKDVSPKECTTLVENGSIPLRRALGFDILSRGEQKSGEDRVDENNRKYYDPFRKEYFGDTGSQRSDLPLDQGAVGVSGNWSFTSRHRGAHSKKFGHYDKLRDCSYVKLASRLLLQVSLNLLILFH